MLIPIYNEVKAIKAGVNTIAEVQALNPNIIVIATKLQKRKKSEDYRNIAQAVAQFDKTIPVLPLKFSAVFDTIFEQEKSIHQLMQTS